MADAANGSNDDGEMLRLRSMLSGAPVTMEQAIITQLGHHRQHQHRQLMSQRTVHVPEPCVDGKRAPLFLHRLGALTDHNAALLQTFSNAKLFERFIRTLTEQMRAGGTTRAASHVDEALARSNAMLSAQVAMPIHAPPADVLLSDANTSSSSCEAIGAHWFRHFQRQCMEQYGVERVARKREADARDAPPTKRAKTAANTSSSSGLVAKALQPWKHHLSNTLKEEGETIESYRQNRGTQDSYLEKEAFLRRAEHNEYARELQIQARQRDLAARRAARRGEADQ